MNQEMQESSQGGTLETVFVRAANGDDVALTELCERLKARLTSLVAAELRGNPISGISADDIVVDVLEIFVRRLPELVYSGDTPLMAWLHTVARNVISNLWSLWNNRLSAGAARNALGEENILDALEAGSVTHSRVVRRAESVRLVGEAVRELPDRERMLVQGFAQGTPWDKVAEDAGFKSAGGALRATRRALEMLREKLGSGGDYSARGRTSADF